MGEHTATAARSTQESNPRKAINRTLIVAVISAFPVLNIALGMIVHELQPYAASIPGWVFAWLNGAILGVTILMAIGTKIMANPAVNDWFRANLPALAPDTLAPVTALPQDQAPVVPQSEQPSDPSAIG